MPRKRDYRARFPNDGNPETLSRKSLEVVKGVYLKSDPDLVDALERTIQENGYRTAPEGVRHLMYIGVAASPADGELRAAMRNIKSQMVQYLTIKYWALLKEMTAEFERDFSTMNAQAMIDEEIRKNREKDGEKTP